MAIRRGDGVPKGGVSELRYPRVLRWKCGLLQRIRVPFFAAADSLRDIVPSYAEKRLEYWLPAEAGSVSEW